MSSYVIEQRHDFYLTYETFVKVRYLAEKIEGPAHIERKIEGIINDVLSKRLKKESKGRGFEYWVDQEAIQQAELFERNQKRIKKIYEERSIEAEAKKRILEREKEIIRKERIVR